MVPNESLLSASDNLRSKRSGGSVVGSLSALVGSVAYIGSGGLWWRFIGLSPPALPYGAPSR